MQQQLDIDGIDVLVEGEGAETIVMIHGWPDTYRVWDESVAALKGRYRCVRFTLPGFDIAKPRQAHSLDETLRIFLHIIKQVSPNGKVTLMLHDWGCFFGYQFYMRHPELVASIIGVDIGDSQSPEHVQSLSRTAKAMVAWYQGMLALAWRFGGVAGNLLTRFMVAVLKAPSPRQYISSSMNYPYYIVWTGAHGSYDNRLPFVPKCPMLYIYGKHKPFMFHSPQWAEELTAKPGSKVLAFQTDHWPMLRQPQEFNQAVLHWLGAPAA